MMHKLLLRQVKRNFLEKELPEDLSKLMHAISQAYDDFEKERSLLERSLELVSEELNERNQELKRKLIQLEDTSIQLSDSLAVLDSIFDATGEAIFAFDNKNRLIRFNKMGQEILGVENVIDVYGTNRVMRKFLQKLGPDEEFYHQLRQLKADPSAQLFGVVGFKDRQLFEYHSAPQFNSGQLIGRVWCFRNVTQLKENEALLQYQAFHDSLTNLPNRVLFTDRLNHAIKLSYRDENLLAILFIDLDHFKKVNDTAGHQLGDKLLVEVASRIKSCLRDHDTLARFGGDEFVVLLENIRSHRIATQKCQSINALLKEPFKFEDNVFHISSSIGVSMYPRDDKLPEELIRKADLAMYHAKEKGRSTFEFFDSPLERIAQYQLSIENKLRDAFINKELSVFYQPQVETNRFSIQRAEALLRWFPDGGGAVSPSEFIPVAERAGLIKDIGYWVMEEVCHRIKSLNKLGLKDFKISLNLSAKQFSDSQLLHRLKSLISQYKVSGENLELEITESMLVEGFENVSELLQKFRDLKITIAIDDFGTGYSSLKYLQKLPIDSIKIDRSFMREFEQNPNNQSIVKAILSLGQNLNLEVVAEGVEDKETVAFLSQRECDFIQGFYFYKPMDGEALVALFEEQMRKKTAL